MIAFGMRIHIIYALIASSDFYGILDLVLPIIMLMHTIQELN